MTTLSLFEKLLISCGSALLLYLLWIAEPPKTRGQQVWFRIRHFGIPAGVFKVLMALWIIVMNVAVWHSGG